MYFCFALAFKLISTISGIEAKHIVLTFRLILEQRTPLCNQSKSNIDANAGRFKIFLLPCQCQKSGMNTDISVDVTYGPS